MAINNNNSNNNNNKNKDNNNNENNTHQQLQSLATSTKPVTPPIVPKATMNTTVGSNLCVERVWQ